MGKCNLFQAINFDERLHEIHTLLSFISAMLDFLRDYLSQAQITSRCHTKLGAMCNHIVTLMGKNKV